MRFLFISSILLTWAVAASAQNPGNFPVVPICVVRADNDANCYADALDDTVCVTGVVLAWHDFGIRGPGAIWDPASGCTISIFDIENEPLLAPGTQVEVCGWVGQFSGLDEIVDNPADGNQDPLVTVTYPYPLMFPVHPISAAALADYATSAETLESSLAFLCGQFVDNGNFSTSSANYLFIDDQGDTTTVRIDSDTGIGGTPIPLGPVSVRGIVGQFDNFNASACTGYQLQPRHLDDFNLGCIVSVEEKNWGIVKKLYRD